MRKSVNKNKKRNNNRRTKRAGFGKKGFARKAAGLAFGQGIRNTKNVYNLARAAQKGDYTAAKDIAIKTGKENFNTAHKMFNAYGSTPQLKTDLNNIANKYGVPNPLEIVGTQAQFNPINQARPQLGQPRVSQAQPQIVPTGQLQRGPFQNFVR